MAEATASILGRPGRLARRVADASRRASAWSTPGLALVLVAGTLLRSADLRAQPACGPAARSDRVAVAVVPRASNALILDATIEVPDPAPVFVEYGSDTLGWLRTPISSAALRHEVPLLRLQPQSAYEVRAFALGEDGCAEQLATARAETGSLPSRLRPRVNEVIGSASSPLILMDHRQSGSSPEARVSWLVAIDGRGSVVWYYEVPFPAPPSPQPTIVIRETARGFLYQLSEVGFEEITRDGRSLRRVVLEAGEDEWNHHDFVELPDGRLLYLGAELRSVSDPPGAPERSVKVDTLQVLDLSSGRSERAWSAIDSLDLSARPPGAAVREGRFEDWTHINSISIGARGNVVLSVRNMDQIVSLSPDLRQVEWRLGGPNGEFAFPEPADRFYAQHAVSELAPNRLLLFDNGRLRPTGEYSRALELELDFSAMTARKAWEYRHSPDFYSSIISSAQRLPNGNTLINFGTFTNTLQGVTMAEYGFRSLANHKPVLSVEARPDGTAQWQHWLEWQGERTTRYRTYPLESLAGEVPVTPTSFRD